MKKPISKSIEHYLTKHADNEEKLSEFAVFVEEFFEEAEEDYPDVVFAFHEEISDFTEEVTVEMLKEIVENLKGRDGTVSGQHWTIEETTALVPQFDIENKLKSLGKKYCPEKFWFAMNYVYAVHYSMSRTINAYVELAIDELANKNICIDDMIKRIFEKM